MSRLSRPKKTALAMTIIVGSMFLLLFGGGALMDPKVALQLDRRLSSPPDALFRFLDTTAGLEQWWSAGQADVPAGAARMRVKKKSGPEQGQGLAVVFVDHEDAVFETWLVVSSQPPSKIVYDVDFAGAMTVRRTLTFTPDSGGTRVTWQEQGRIDRPALRWMKVLMSQEDLAANFDHALAALDRIAGVR